VRWHDPSRPLVFPRYLFSPLEMAIVGPKDEKVRDFAAAFVKRLEESKKVKVSADLTLQPQMHLQIDPEAARENGVDVVNLFSTFSSLHTEQFVARTGRGTTIVVQVDSPRRGNKLEGKDAQVTNDKGEKIPLSKVAKYNMYPAPAAIDRLDGEPMVRISADSASGVSVSEVFKLCESAAEHVRHELRLPAAYRLTSLPGVAAPK
jgi:multidrug efflux pump subunit AcrB